jgi:hypothetical protein
MPRGVFLACALGFSSGGVGGHARGGDGKDGFFEPHGEPEAEPRRMLVGELVRVLDPDPPREERGDEKAGADPGGGALKWCTPAAAECTSLRVCDGLFSRSGALSSSPPALTSVAFWLPDCLSSCSRRRRAMQALPPMQRKKT